jgi:hypothetical protein
MASGAKGIATTLGCDPSTEDTITLLTDWVKNDDSSKRATGVYTAGWARRLVCIQISTSITWRPKEKFASTKQSEVTTSQMTTLVSSGITRTSLLLTIAATIANVL